MTEQQTIEVITEAPNYWWLLTIAVLPVMLGFWLRRKK